MVYDPYDVSIQGPHFENFRNDELWPYNRLTDKICMDYYASIPSIPLVAGMQEYIKCFPLGGREGEKYNPYEDELEPWQDFRLVEIYTEEFMPFGTHTAKEEAEHFLKAITRRYYAFSQSGVYCYKDSEKCNVSAFIFADLIRDRFDTTECCWLLENWA